MNLFATHSRRFVSFFFAVEAKANALCQLIGAVWEIKMRLQIFEVPMFGDRGRDQECSAGEHFIDFRDGQLAKRGKIHKNFDSPQVVRI